MGKKFKGGLEISVTEIIGLIVAIVFILIVLYAFRNFGCAKKDVLQDKSLLEDIINKLEKTKENEGVSVLFYTSLNKYLIFFPKDQNKVGGFEKPENFFGSNTLCICDKKCHSDRCMRVEKEIRKDEQPLFWKISMKEIIFINRGEFFEFALERKIVEVELSEKEKEMAKEIEIEKTKEGIEEKIDSFFEEKAPKFVGLGKCINEVSKKYEIDIEIIIAVALHETGYGKNFVCNNLFGIKGEGCEAYTQEFISGEFKRTKMPFADYSSMCESVFAFGKLISTNYASALKKENLEEKIKEIGKNYATDPQWANKVIKIAKQVSEHLKKINKINEK